RRAEIDVQRNRDYLWAFCSAGCKMPAEQSCRNEKFYRTRAEAVNADKIKARNNDYTGGESCLRTTRWRCTAHPTPPTRKGGDQSCMYALLSLSPVSGQPYRSGRKPRTLGRISLR